MPEIIYQRINEQGAFPDLPFNLESLSFDGSDLQDYFVVTQANANKSIKVTFAEVLKEGLFALISYSIGSVATIAYIGPSKKAANGNEITAVLNIAGSILLNSGVNGFFFNEVVSQTFNNFIEQQPKKAREALYRLQKLDSKLSAKILRSIKALFSFVFILGPAFLPALQLYFLDKSENDDPEILSIIILLSSTMLQYKSVEALLLKGLPILGMPIQALQRRLSFDQRVKYQNRRLIEILKSTHCDALIRAHKKVLQLIQQGDEAQLNPFYELLNQDNKDLLETSKLLFGLCTLSDIDEYEPSSKGRLVLQILGLLITTGSLPGYFLKMTIEASHYLKLTDPLKVWSLGTGMFLIAVALSYDISWEVFGNLYDFSASFLTGVKLNWRNSSNLKDFLIKAWKGKFSLESWHTLIKLPLAVQQNPKFMLSTLCTFYALSYWSAATSTYLNEETLGKTAANYLEAPTVIAVMIFNSYPIDKIFASIQRFMTRLIGSPKSKNEIKLEQFIKNQIDFISSIEPDKFLDVLHDMADGGDTEKRRAEKEKMIKGFMGNKTPSDIYGKNNSYAQLGYTTIVERLKQGKAVGTSLIKQATNQVSRMASNLGIFRQEHTHELKSYGSTRSTSAPAAFYVRSLS